MHLPGIGHIEKLGETASELADQAAQLQAMYPTLDSGTAASIITSDAARQEEANPEKPFPWPWVFIAGGIGVYLLLRRPDPQRFGRR